MEHALDSGRVTSGKNLKKINVFDLHAFLNSAGVKRTVATFRKSQKIYSQGDPASDVMYIQTGSVKISVVNESGKEAVVAILGPDDFFGEASLLGHRFYLGTAAAITQTVILVVEKKEMMRVLHTQHSLADHFIAHLLSRNLRVEEDLVDQLFNSSEKRLARTLLLLAHYGKESRPKKMLPKVSQEMLAGMIGTTRSRVSFFMNKFRKLGFIHYNGGIEVHDSLLNIVLHD
jgi:CRP/FNR family transcriptional regulator, cyclic AMP receptor protein